jgi:alpha-tubulin suppressor-like RCC1 family protein
LIPGIPNLIGIAAGNEHTCAVEALGTVKCWGLNSSGQLGDNTVTTRRVPTQVYGQSTFVTIARGGYHTCALGVAGSALCWGLNTSGQLGDGTTTNRRVPVKVSGL